MGLIVLHSGHASKIFRKRVRNQFRVPEMERGRRKEILGG